MIAASCLRAAAVFTAGGPGQDDLPHFTSDESPAEAQRPRILIVEDEYLVGLVAEDALASAGYAVLAVANNAVQAVASAVSDRPDLVIMDIRLGAGPDGIDAAMEIFAKTGVRCIFATASTDASTRERGQLAKPLGWLNKPYDGPAIVAMVAQALRAAKQS